jgi:hypothetical protein
MVFCAKVEITVIETITSMNIFFTYKNGMIIIKTETKIRVDTNRK